MILCTGLIVVNLLALGSGIAVMRTRVAWIGLGTSFYLGVWDRAWLYAPMAMEKWWLGGAQIIIANRPGDDPAFGRDPETRLDRMDSCRTTSREAWVNNTTLRLLHRHFGPADGTWQGRVPSGDEARALLDARGTDLYLRLDRVKIPEEFRLQRKIEQRSFVHGGTGMLDGHPMHFRDPPWRDCAEADDSLAKVRVARLDTDSVVIRCGGEVGVYPEFRPGEYYEFQRISGE